MLSDARDPTETDPYQFQWRALGLVDARPTDGKKGADKGIDDRLYFHDDNSGKTKQVIFSVKCGRTGVAHIHELRGVIDRENAEIGVFITLREPTKPVRTDAATAGFYTSPWGKHPRMQILTIAELLEGERIDMPSAHGTNATFQQAPKAIESKANQSQLEL